MCEHSPASQTDKESYVFTDTRMLVAIWEVVWRVHDAPANAFALQYLQSICNTICNI
jgi:hypothetical protein